MIFWSVFAGVVVIGIALDMLFFPACNGSNLTTPAYDITQWRMGLVLSSDDTSQINRSLLAGLVAFGFRIVPESA
jgi:hypothetical protein